MKSYTYKITHKQTNKSYIGSRKSKDNDLMCDLKSYKSSSRNKHFKKELEECPDNFTFEIIDVFDNYEDCINNEVYLHDYYNVSENDMFYNLAKQTSTGFTTYNYKHTEETKKIMSDKSNKKRENNVMYNNKHSKNTIDKITEKAKLRTHPKETIDKIIKSNSKGVSINGVIYENSTIASKEIGLSKSCIDYRLKSNSNKFEKWFRLGKKIRKVEINGVIYISAKEGYTSLGMNKNKFFGRLNSSNFPEYKYVD